jgi:outer membrane usher protein
LSGDGVRRSRFPARGIAAIVAALTFITARAAMAQDAELVLPITINAVPHGETPAIIAGNDVYVPISTLERTGLTGPMWERLQLVARLRGAERTIGDERAVSLRGLAPLATFVFDEANLTISVTVNPELMRRHELAITSARPADISYRHDPGGFFNYAVTATGSERPSGFGEAAVTAGRGLFYTAFSDTEEQGLIRGLTNWSYDQRNLLRRWTAGDASVFSDELGGAGIVGGFTVARRFEIDPYFIRYPSMSLRGIATTPSQVDVYVNGVLVSRQTIDPGPFDVQNLPAVAGPTNAQIVVRDVFGREQTQSSSFYYSTAILGRGVRDYVYSAGFVRENLSTNFDYERPVAVAYHRYGITERITIGARVEATDEIVSGGPSISFGSRIADLDLKTAVSSAGGDIGTAAQISIRRLSRRANLSVAYRAFSSEYQNFSLGREIDRPLGEVLVNGSYLAKWGTLGLQWANGRLRDAGRQERVTLLSNIPILDRVDLLLSAASTRLAGSSERMTEYFAGFSVYGWGRNTVNLGATRTEGRDMVTAEVQQPLTLGDSWGYRLQTASGDGETNGNASLQYQNRFGRFEVFTPLRDASLTATAAGGLVFQGGRVLPARPVSQGFALVRVPGIENVRVYLSNQLIGRTDRRGDLLVPELLSYYGNRIRIDHRDIPMTYDVQVVEQTIAPFNRGGALVEFPVRAVRSATGSLVVQRADGSSFVPAYGQVTLTRASVTEVSPVGGGGEFYFENLSSGAHQALVEYENGSCRVDVTIPDVATEVIDVGRVVCKEAAKP